MDILNSPSLVHTAFNPVVFIMRDEYKLPAQVKVITRASDGSDGLSATMQVEFYTETVSVDVSMYLKTLFSQLPDTFGSQSFEYCLEWGINIPTRSQWFTAVRSVAQIGEQQDLDIQVGKILTGFDRLISWQGYERKHSILDKNKTTGIISVKQKNDNFCETGGIEDQISILFTGAIGTNSGVKSLSNQVVTQTVINTKSFGSSVAGYDGQSYWGLSNDNTIYNVNAETSGAIDTISTKFQYKGVGALPNGVTVMGGNTGVAIFKDGILSKSVANSFQYESLTGAIFNDKVYLGSKKGFMIIDENMDHISIFDDRYWISQIIVSSTGIAYVAATNMASSSDTGLFRLNEDNTMDQIGSILPMQPRVSFRGNGGSVYFFEKTETMIYMIGVESGTTYWNLQPLDGSLIISGSQGPDGYGYFYCDGSGAISEGVYRIEPERYLLRYQLIFTPSNPVTGMILGSDNILYMGTDNSNGTGAKIYTLNEDMEVTEMDGHNDGFYLPVELIKAN